MILLEFTRQELSKCILAQILKGRGENEYQAMKNSGISPSIVDNCMKNNITLTQYEKKQLEILKTIVI